MRWQFKRVADKCSLKKASDGVSEKQLSSTTLLLSVSSSQDAEKVRQLHKMVKIGLARSLA
jgi:hypothetical protein